MDTLPAQQETILVIMACLIAAVAAFTGLSLTRDMSQKPLFQQKVSISLAAVALGGGIWSMHFVAMLGLQLPFVFYYDAVVTFISALTAILIVGMALVLLQFVERTPTTITAAGCIVGIGVLAMHYIGMAGLELCRAVYSPVGIVVSSIVAIGLCVVAIWVAYGKRTIRNIYFGTFCLAGAVSSVHFLAMAGTRYAPVPNPPAFGLAMSNEVLALGVIFSSFVLFGTFLWVSVTYLLPKSATVPASPAPAVPTRPAAPAPAPRPRKCAPRICRSPVNAMATRSMSLSMM